MNEEDIEQIERKPKSPILSPDIQRMIDEIEGVIPEEESEEIPVHTSTPVEPLENKEAATEELRMESEELTLEVDSAEDYEDLLTEDAAEELEEESKKNWITMMIMRTITNRLQQGCRKSSSRR